MSVEAEELVELVLASPIGVMTFWCAAREGAGVDDLADPTVITYFQACGSREMSLWHDSGPGDRRASLELADGVRATVREVVHGGAATWWTQSIAGSRQHAILGAGRDSSLDITAVARPPDALAEHLQFQQYAQHPPTLAVTSTLLTGRNTFISGQVADIANWQSDNDPLPPLRTWRAAVGPDVTVVQIDKPADWHALVLAHPSSIDPEADAPPGIVAGPAPSWRDVSLTGAHLSFAGAMTTPFVPVTTNGLTTTLWTWQSERTWWLRPGLLDVERLADISTLPDLDDGWR